ncbi:MAG: ACP S-malonyltransferase [Fimbriimonadales bacterium]
MHPKAAVVFPGQGSQKQGMGQSIFEDSEEIQDLYAQIESAAGLDLEKICFDSCEDELRETQNAQPALFATGVAAFRHLTSQLPSFQPQFMAGHSVGEYAALTCAGVMPLEDASRAVKRRGEIMAAAGMTRPGAMAAVLGGEQEAIEAACRSCSGPGNEVVVANYNCPGQIVISGDESAVTAAEAPLKAAGCKRVTKLNVSGAFHSPLMAEGAEALAVALADCAFTQGQIAVVSNVTADLVAEPEEWRDLMTRQLASPVRWVQSIEKMIGQGVSVFIECGSGEVLCGLIRRISGEVKTVAYNSPEDLELVSEALS